MSVLEINNLCKTYPGFSLENVSFSLEDGKITGFVGRNGAGKSTTLSSIFGFVHPDSGKILLFGKELFGNEAEIRENVGYVSGGIDFYTKKKLKSIAAVTKSFYKNWDEDSYQKYMKLFSLDESKTPSALSSGMKTKFSIVLALSHGAQLLILDEPTSGLDPVSRDELLEIFMTLKDEGKTILFSTHIISDLEKCADNIVYIKKGKILADSSISEFENSFRIISLPSPDADDGISNLAIGKRRTKSGFDFLLKTSDAKHINQKNQPASLEEIMILCEKSEEADDDAK